MRIEAPSRVSHTYTQHLNAPMNEVFPLFCPVRECEWATNWQPTLVLSHSGVAEPDSVFMTPAHPQEAIWYITQHEPARHFVEMLKITPEVTACKLSIQLAPASVGCAATITYTHTSLGPHGDEFVAGFTWAYYASMMQEWESELNAFLAQLS